jgi:integrase
VLNVADIIECDAVEVVETLQFARKAQVFLRIEQPRQDQAHPLGWKEIKEFIESVGEGLRADRERAMLCVAYETLARRGELVVLEVKDLDFHPDGTGLAMIRRGKTDAEG